MEKISLKAKDATLDAVLLRAPNSTQKILFSAGSGGNPERHLPLLNSFVQQGWTVLAPFFERIMSPFPGADELTLRGNGLEAAMGFLGDLDGPTVGVGHSIGATLLLALAGGKMYMPSRERLFLQKDDRLKKLVLFTPPTGFFQAPEALKDVQIPIQVWAGSLDVITPAEQMEVLSKGLPSRTSFDLRIAEGANHFSFMNTIPPSMNDRMEDREGFLLKLSQEACRFAKV